MVRGKRERVQTEKDGKIEGANDWAEKIKRTREKMEINGKSGSRRKKREEIERKKMENERERTNERKLSLQSTKILVGLFTNLLLLYLHIISYQL